MMNFPDRVTITAKATRAIDPDTGLPVQRDSDVAVNAPCAFAVLTATEKEQSFGDGTVPTETPTVSGSLLMPLNGPELNAEASEWILQVSGYPGNWRVVSARPGRDWNSYLLLAR